jgi:hypothetical protein
MLENDAEKATDLAFRQRVQVADLRLGETKDEDYLGHAFALPLLVQGVGGRSRNSSSPVPRTLRVVNSQHRLLHTSSNFGNVSRMEVLPEKHYLTERGESHRQMRLRDF